MRLSRRQILRGAGGIMIGLPALEALIPRVARAQPTPPPKRFIAVYHANGVFTPQWFPTAGANESDFALKSVHTSLERFKPQLLMTGGLDMSVALSGPGEQHQRGVGAFLTGQKLDAGNFVGNDGSRAGYAKGASIDQRLVGVIGQGTRVGSLQLGVHTLLANVAGVVSYSGPNQPLLPQNDPRLTFRTLFMDSGMPPTELDKVRARRKSVLDAVQEQLAALKKNVSTSDKARLDHHLTLVRDLERRVTALPTGTCTNPGDPGAVDYTAEMEMPRVSGLQIDLMLLAFRCDLTRVATLMFSDAMNHVAMPFICDTASPPKCVTTDVHNLTHFSDGDPTRALVALRDAWICEQVARILAGLEGISEADGSNALAHSLLYWGSDVSRGNVHAHDDMPFVLAGGGAGFRMGRYVRWQSQYHNDLLLSIVKGLGSDVTTYGDPAFCRGPLSNLT
ncbi:MAG: hypothetical protein AMXMBFR34_16200 [Myxococcaceae bacterium]